MVTRAGAGLLERGALWETPRGVGADLSSGSSGYQSGTGHTGSDLMKEHLAEIRSLRRRLEESIQTNDRLRLQLEDRLAHSAGDKGAPTNIYIQGLDSAGQLSELRLLQEENAALQAQLQRASREGSREAELRREAEHLREAVLQERSRLKEAELETQRWAELSQRLQAEDAVRCQEVAQLRQDRQRNQETINRLQHEASVLRLQLDQSRSLSQTLQEAKRRGWENPRHTHPDEVANGALPVTFDPRELHIQQKQQLSSQPAARRRLFSGEDVSPPVRDSGPIRDSGPVRDSGPIRDSGPVAAPAVCAQQGGAPEGGHQAVGHLGDLLQQQLLEGATLAAQMEAALCSLNASQRLHQPLDRGCVSNLLSDSKTLKRTLQEAESLLQATWTADLSDSEEARRDESLRDESLRDEVVCLRMKLSERDQALRDAMERLKSSSLTKDSMEHFIVSQLSRTRDVLRRAKTNLQENKLRICSLPASVSVPSPPSGPVKVKSQGAPLSSAPLLVGAS
ncbi:PREDICTED: myomegalin-like [Poecilia mexicana]|uniref:myomegalin-like n=1 Tax=Poecilia mexicana TaxID=48701 RepID=UPI00072EBCB7|nr:PREDICTED: myomegalin-like [Poecilia mexicana]